MAIPDGYYGRIVCCSSIAKKYGIMVHNGTTDLDYWGNVGVILFNFSNEEYVVKRGNHVTQMVIEITILKSLLRFMNLPKKLKEGRAVWVLQVFDVILSF